MNELSFEKTSTKQNNGYEFEKMFNELVKMQLLF